MSPLRLVPGGSDGPSGVLICSENYITYKNFGDQPDIRCPIPRRRVSHSSKALYTVTHSQLYHTLTVLAFWVSFTSASYEHGIKIWHYNLMSSNVLFQYYDFKWKDVFFPMYKSLHPLHFF